MIYSYIRLFLVRFSKRLTPIIGKVFGPLISRLIVELELFKLTIKSLFSNVHINNEYVIDTLLEPLFWFVDHFTESLGPIFVVLMITLLTIYVSIAYTIGLSFWLSKSYFITCIALIIGNWILFNMIFHYYMGLITSPGYPPSNEIITEVISICKKCIGPKPPRTHHCSVCDKCILAMDHHCPWLNNCVGHFNRRYFFMFCAYTWLGCIFVVIFGLPIAYEFYFIEESSSVKTASMVISQFKNSTTDLVKNSEKNTSLQFSSFEYFSLWKENCILFEILATGAAFAAVGALMFWHASLITKGETCIESHINKKEREKAAKIGKTFKNPFDEGVLQNWKIFLGLNQYGLSWRHILLPSGHKPNGDGYNWYLYDI